MTYYSICNENGNEEGKCKVTFSHSMLIINQLKWAGKENCTLIKESGISVIERKNVEHIRGTLRNAITKEGMVVRDSCTLIWCTSFYVCNQNVSLKKEIKLTIIIIQ